MSVAIRCQAWYRVRKQIWHELKGQAAHAGSSFESRFDADVAVAGMNMAVLQTHGHRDRMFQNSVGFFSR